MSRPTKRLLTGLDHWTGPAVWHNMVQSSWPQCRSSDCCPSTCPVICMTTRQSTRSPCPLSRKDCFDRISRGSVALTSTILSPSCPTSTVERRPHAPEVSQVS